jgi:hypothetical protein
VRAVDIHQAAIRVDKTKPWVPIEEVDLAAQLVRFPQVVIVEKRDQLAARGFNAAVARRTRPARVREAEVADRGAERLHPRGRVVGGPVVADDDLEVAKRLRLHAGDGLGQQRGAIVGGDDHRDARRCRHRA